LKNYLKILFVLGLVLGIVGLASAQVSVWLPDTTALPGTTITVPLYISEVTAAMNVTWYNFQVNYDNTVVTATDVTFTGTITPSSWTTQFNVGSLGEVLAGAFGMLPPTLVGQGALTNIVFNVPSTATGMTDLEFEFFIYGYPQTIVTGGNGSITVQTAPSAITNLVIDVQGNTNIVLTWGAVPNATSYNIYRGTTAYFTPTTVYQNVTTTTFTDAGAVTTGAKFYIVTAVN